MKNNKIAKSVAYIIIISFLASTFNVGISGPKARAAATSTLYFTPATTEAANDSDFTLDAVINPNGNSIYGVRINITYDETKLSLTGATCSETFSERLYPRTGGTVVPSPEDGTARIDCGISPSAADATDISTVATFSFTAIDVVTNSPVAFMEESMAADNEESGDALISMVPASVTITESESADATDPIVTAFTIPSKSTSRTISITTFTATDDVAVTGYKITESATAPSANDSGWSNTALSSYIFATHGSKTLYAWAKDGDGNVSSSLSSSINVTKKSKKKKKKKSTPKFYISNSKSKVTRGAIMTQRGKKFSKNSLVLLYFSRSGGGYYAPTRIMTSSKGAFFLSYRMAKPKGKYSWYAVDVKTGKRSKTKYYTVK